MTVLGPNDPRAMHRDDPRLLRPEGDTLMEQIDNMAEMLVSQLTDEDYAELAAALGTALKGNDDDTPTD